MKLPRRQFLKLSGTAGLAGFAGVTSARGTDQAESLRLFGDVAVSGALEVSTQGNYAYVATGDGLSVVDWTTPGRPNVVGTMTASAPAGGILDAKVDGDLAALASNGGPGITLVDVSDPTTPTEYGFVDVGHHIHNVFLHEGYAYLTVNESGSGPFSEARTTIVDVSDPTAPTTVGAYRLKDDFPGYAAGGVNPCHDIYVQDDVLYQAFWDAGVVVADVSDPTDPQTITQFGAAPMADTPVGDSFPTERYLTAPGNAHYVQPSPDGSLVYVGAETFPDGFVSNPDNDDYGGIRVFDVSNPASPMELARIDPPNVDAFRTSHNFDVTANRLHASWYDGGVTVHDVSDPANPETLSGYHADGSSFWGAQAARGFTVASDIGGGLVFLHEDTGQQRPPAFEGTARPTTPGIR
ncbi:LVIVD repeat-containing protein [Haloferax sp. DFSO52]|uniref:LVIVD repeat-containing protein n=1 Tax=Haloferax sp. DFSO52 TaxID=3388505 RepID=UPI003A88FB23